MKTKGANSDSGFFTVSVAVLLMCAGIVIIALITLATSTSKLAERRGAVLQARYAAEALLVRTRREIETAGLALPAWQEAQRREVWDGQTSALRVFAGPLTETGARCAEMLGLPQVQSPDALMLVAGVLGAGGFQAEVADVVANRAGALSVIETRLIPGRTATACLDN